MKSDFCTKITEEMQRAVTLYGDFNSLHEGLAVIWEEFEELKEEIFKKNPDLDNLQEESVQLAAMCYKMYMLVEKKTK